MITTDLGIVTAYGEAVAKGYKGTKEEFGKMLAEIGNTSSQMKESLEAIEQARKDISQITSSYLKHQTGESGPMISFIDDDCRLESYEKLFPVIKELNIPYMLACPPEQIGTDGYMSDKQLKEMNQAGVEIASHHLRQYNMNQFQSREEYRHELEKCKTAFDELELEASVLCYPQGVYVDEYMDIVKEFYHAGFTVDRGINTTPLETCFIKRVEVFPTSGIYDLEDVKGYVDKVVSGGWLIFLTHSWYSTFDAAKLKELVQYINEKGIRIVGVKNALEKIGNILEYGVLKKPLEYMNTPFYCIDAVGNVYTNSQKFYQASNEKVTRVSAGYNAGYNLSVSGRTIATSDKKRLVSEKVSVLSGDIYLISASNVYGNALYVIYDENNTVIAYKAAENTATGTIMLDEKVTIPDGASYIRIASNLSIQPESYSICKMNTVPTEHDLMDKTLTKEGVPADAKATGEAIKEAVKNIEPGTAEIPDNIVLFEEIEDDDPIQDVEDSVIKKIKENLTLNTDSEFLYLLYAEEELAKVPVGSAGEVIACTGVTINEADMTIDISSDKAYTFTATVTPTDCTQSLKWFSSNPSVATVSLSGTLKIVGTGSTVISVRCGSYTDTINVTIVDSNIAVNIDKDGGWFISNGTAQLDNNSMRAHTYFGDTAPAQYYADTNYDFGVPLQKGVSYVINLDSSVPEAFYGPQIYDASASSRLVDAGWKNAGTQYTYTPEKDNLYLYVNFKYTAGGTTITDGILERIKAAFSVSTEV